MSLHTRRVRLDSLPQGITLLSDLHIGSSHVDYEHLVRDLTQAKRHRDRIALNGDIFDWIVPSDKKRYSPGALHPRLQGVDDILSAALEWAVELLGPVAHLIDLIGAGNHDDAALKHSSFDPVALLIKLLDLPPSTHGGYAGFLRYSCERMPFNICYWHGKGGGNNLGSALGEFDKRAGFVENADVVWFGHRHIKLASQIEKVSCRRGRILKSSRWLVRTAGYLDPYFEADRTRPRSTNYAADAFLSPYGRGAVRLVLQRSNTSRLSSRVELW